MLDITRRDFVKAAGAGAAASMMPGLFAQDAGKTVARGKPTLVTIYLRGGQDALNVLVPFGDKRYKEIRPTIAVPEKDSEEDGAGIVALDAMFGLHPSLKALKPLWDAKQLAPICNTGSPHDTRSHFDAQDFMEYAAPGSRTIKAGWLNRYLEATKGKDEKKDDKFTLRALAMQPLLPRACRGCYPVLAVPERNVLNNEKVLDTFGEMYGSGMESREEDPVVAAGQDTIETLKRYKEAVAKHRGERKVTYPGGGLGSKLQDIASVIHAGVGLEVASLDVGGWDHHANEGGSEGTLATMLKNVGDSLAAFAQDMGDGLSNVMVLVMTEFGRTCRENGNRGTDHGHGGLMLALGGAVKGGKVHGKWTSLEDKDLYQARDLPVTTDFRDVFCEVLRSHMKFEPPKGFFPDYGPGGVKGLF
jgi:uncharacterized protein (DUF1501 family)